MRYPYLTVSKCLDLARRRIAGDRPGVEPHVEWPGEGTDVDLRQIPATVALIDAEMSSASNRSPSDRDRVEGRASVLLYEALQNVDPEVLDDPGFWRYLSLAHFWDFIAWRESEAFTRGNFEPYVDGRTATECVLTRMYARGASVGGLDHLVSAEAVREATDFWRSHVLRVKTCTAPPVVRAFVDMQASERLRTDDLREYAKGLNRMWANVVPAIYDDEDAGALIAELREGMFPVESHNERDESGGAG